VLAATNPWRFQPHPEVWLLVVSVVAAYIYAIRVVGPKVVRPGEQVVSRRQLGWFIGGALILWLASDWPLHDISEEYLYSMHMVQHMALSYFMPPMMLLAIPEWLMRLIIGEGRGYSVAKWFTKPVVAGVLFNGAVMVSHVPAIVNRSAAGGPLHYSIHVVLVSTSLLMWMCVCGPIPEFRIAHAPRMLYLFTQSLVPTVPAGWLTFAEGTVYKHYGLAPLRLWHLSVQDDQQLAGVIMKIGGSVFLWTLCVVFFFRGVAKPFYAETAGGWQHIPGPGAQDLAQPDLTMEHVTKAFDLSPPTSAPDAY
jgi:putative membrane protein